MSCKNELIEMRDTIVRLFTVFSNIQVSEYRSDYDETQNPLWIWYAINYCRSNPQQRSIYWAPFTDIQEFEKAEENPDSINYDAQKIEARDLWRSVFENLPQALPIPEWCNDYLGKCATKIFDLATSDEVTTAEAAQKTPEAFGFVRRGWNAYSEGRKEYDREQIFKKFEELYYTDGLTKAQARKIILEEMNFTDERNLQKILSKRANRRGKTYREGLTTAKHNI